MEAGNLVSAANVSMKLPADNNADQKLIMILNLTAFGFVCQLIVLFGIGTNIINIICFVKQGFKEHINVSLSVMAVSDLLNLSPVLWSNVSVCLSVAALDLTFDPVEVQRMVTALPHTLFTRFTAWITACITLERCLCIAIPLKVKNIITHSRVYAVLAFILIVLVACQIPFYVVNRLDWKYFPARNKSLIAIIGIDSSIDTMLFIINNVVLNFCAFIVTIVCTITLAIQLHNRVKWRATAKQATKLSNQNTTIAKLVVAVSTIFIICFTPNCIFFILMSLFNEFTVKGKYKIAVFMMGAVGTILESINASVNIFVYYHMSTKYRKTILRLFYVK